MRFWLELTACFALNPGTLITGIDLCSPVPDTQGPVSAESLHPFTSKQKQPLYRWLLFSLKDGSDLVRTDSSAGSEEPERTYFESPETLKRDQSTGRFAFIIGHTH